MLTRPTNKEFSQMVMFLIRKIDPNFTDTSKFEDEFVNVMKFLGYPHAISKQNLAAVGAPHAWPSMLAALLWLCELVEYNHAVIEDSVEATSSHFTIDLSDSSAATTGFYKFLELAYSAFLAGKDDELEQLEAQVRSAFGNSCALVRDELEIAQKKNRLLAVEIEDVKAQSDRLSALEAKKRELKAMHSKLQGDAERIQRASAGLKDEVSTRQEQCAQLCKSRDEMCARNALLVDKIHCQELSALDVNNMHKEKSRLENAL
eukprot:gene4998-6380_t